MITLKRARQEDCRLIWKWANDPDVRAVSFSSKPIPYDTHTEWFKAKLSDSNCLFYIAEEITHGPVGQVRYDMNGTEATISVSLDRSFRGKGYGSLIIARASEQVFATTCINMIHAYVKKENTGSVKAFIKAGFKLHDDTIVNHQHAKHILRIKEELT